MDPKIPSWWTRLPAFPSQKSLFEYRKSSFLPHHSYDLDKDGEVGTTDLFVASKFDLDKDNQLNEAERTKAENAIKHGFLEQFEFGGETHGKQRPNRLLQVRGVIITDEDFSQLRGTYPEFPHKDTPNIRTLTELKTLRKTQAKAEANRLAEKCSSHSERVLRPVPPATKRPEVPIERAKTNSDVEFFTKNLPLTYSDAPRFSSYSQMKTAKKEEILSGLSQACNFQHIPPEKRVTERDLLLAGPQQAPRDTWSSKRALQKQADLQSTMAVFANRSLGIHGKELPKFSEHNPQYWNYNKPPRKPPVSAPATERPALFLARKQETFTEKPTHLQHPTGLIIDETAHFKPSSRKDSFVLKQHHSEKVLPLKQPRKSRTRADGRQPTIAQDPTFRPQLQTVRTRGFLSN